MSDFLTNIARRAVGLVPGASRPVPARPAEPGPWLEVSRLDSENGESSAEPVSRLRPDSLPELPQTLWHSPPPAAEPQNNAEEPAPHQARPASPPGPQTPSAISETPSARVATPPVPIRPRDDRASTSLSRAPAIEAPTLRPSRPDPPRNETDTHRPVPLVRSGAEPQPSSRPADLGEAMHGEAKASSAAETRIVPRPSPEEPRGPVPDAAMALRKADPAPPQVEVRIGRIEIEIAQPAPAPPAQRERPRGFDDYARLRSYLER